MFAARPLERLEVATGHDRPLHVAPESGCPTAQLAAFSVVGEERYHLARDRAGITPRHQNAAVLGEDFACVPIRCRNRRLARANGIGQRARGDLFGLEVGRDVDVTSREKLGELGLADESVVENHVRVDAQLFRARFEHQPVHFAVVFAHVRMGRAQHDVKGLREALENRRQRIDDRLDALVRRKQSKGEDDQAPLDAQAILALSCGHEIGDPVMDHVDLVLRHAVHTLQERCALFAHDDDPLGQSAQLAQDRALQGRRLGQNGVQGADDGHAQVTQEGQNVTARLATEDPVLVLHAGNVDRVHVQKIGSPLIGSGVVLGNFETDARRIRIVLARVVHRDNETVEVRKLTR